MNNLEIQLNELSRVESNLALVQSVVNWLRPDDVTQIQGVEEKVRRLAHAMAANPEQAAVIRTKMRTFLVKLRFLPLYSDTGILPRRGFPTEFWRRVYDKFMPEPPIIFSAKNLLDRVFDNRHDSVWIKAVSDETWMQLYRTFIPAEPDNKVALHLLDEALYALEMLSIWLAAEEMEAELLRLDPSIADHDSIFIAQGREITRFVAAYRAHFIPAKEPTAKDQPLDAAHAWVMLQQCDDQINRFRQFALRKGSDLKLTYLLERLEKILARIRALLGILDEKDVGAIQTKSLALFRQLVAEQSTEHSVTGLLRQTSYLLAKSVTNLASKTGEHYVTEDRRGYIEMLGRGLGAGVFIAVMALIKIRIVAMELPMEWTTLWVSLNYGLGFVIIHMLHFTVATKQPAMTAAYIAEKLEHARNGSVDQTELAQLIVKVGRSQFAAILGNVAAALPVALVIGLVVNALTGSAVMKPAKAAELMQGQNPLTSLALFYAAVAGIWLFVAGLVAGYFDNRALYLDLPGRIRQHPLLERLLSPKQRNRLADYISEHYGALWGNFFFGVMLGVTAYVGYLLSVPLDIRHVAFSVANVGYSSIVTWPGIWVFLEFVCFALVIGVVNLTVSFVFALNVAIRSRGIRLGGIGSIIKACWQEVRHRPWGLVLPPTVEPDRSQQHAQG
ncbi:MAG TPA: site-specific recombinase [Anaerolineae bacterium]|nr:site-specific recombinase [Anaerolineae bacterium]